MKIYLYPYNQHSESAKNLAVALEGKIIKREGSKFKPGPDKKVVNWGASDCPYDALNSPLCVKAVSNKLFWFKHLKNLSETHPNARVPRVPNWTEARGQAFLWNQEDKTVVCRTVLNGHSGEGIVIRTPEDLVPLPDAPLYVEYIPKDAEYRIHIFNGEVIDVQRKVRDPNREPSDWKVRSHDNGFIFTRNDTEGRSHKDTVPKDVLDQSLAALACSGLVFAACDVIWNKKREKAYVLELNSAPGCEGETVNVYRDAIRKYYQI